MSRAVEETVEAGSPSSRRAWPRRIGPLAHWAPADDTPAHLSVAIPPSVPAARHEPLVERLTERLRADTRAMGIRRELHVQPGPVLDPAAITVHVDGRPVAVVALSGLGPDGDVTRWTAAAVRQAHDLIRHRYALLLSATERAEHAAKLKGSADDDRDELVDTVPEYLLANGVSLASLDARPATWSVGNEPSTAAVGELAIEALAPRTMVVVVSAQTLRTATSADADLVPELRARLLHEVGVALPDLVLQSSAKPTTELTVRLNDVEVRTGIDNGDWRTAVAAIEVAVRRRAAWFVRESDTAATRNGLSETVAALVELSRTTYSDAVVAACCRELVRSGENVRNLQRILWLLHDTSGGPETTAARFTDLAADVATDPRDTPASMASRIRARIFDEAWRAGGAPPAAAAVSVSDELGADLIGTDGPRRAAAEQRIVTAVGQGPRPPLLAAPSVRSIAALRSAVSALPDPPRVVAQCELPVDFPISTLRAPTVRKPRRVRA